MSLGKLTITDVEINMTPEIRKAIEDTFPGRKNLFPLCQQELEFVLDGVSPCISNAFQRVMTEEIPGFALHVEITDVTPAHGSHGRPIDPFMAPEFLQRHIQNIPLRYGIEIADVEDITLTLDEHNPTDEAKEVYTGDLKFFKKGKPYKPPLPFFNPTTVVALLQPNKGVLVENIRFVSSTARIFAGTASAVRGRQRPLDIPELPRERTHVGFQGDALKSGFDADTFTVQARKHLVGATVVAAIRGSRTAKNLPIAACHKILQGLRNIKAVVERGEQMFETSAGDFAALEGSGDDNNSWVVQGVGETTDASVHRGILQRKGETRALLQPVLEELNELVPDAVIIKIITSPDSNNIRLQLDIRGSPKDLSANVLQAVVNVMKLFTKLSKQFEAK